MIKVDPINFTDPAFIKDPFPVYARLRAEDPVHRTVLPDGRPLWLITGYDLGVAVLKDERFVKDFRFVGADTAYHDNQFSQQFGHGAHYCLGAPLARLEGQIAISTLLRRAPNLRLRVPNEALEYRVSLIIRGLQEVPVAL